MAYGTPRDADDIEAVLHRHPPRPAADARAARRPASAATTRSAGISPLAERTEAQRAALAAALDGRRRAVSRWCSARSTPRRSSRTPCAELAGRRASTTSSAWCWRRTTRRCRVGQYHERAATARRRARRRRRRHRALAPRAGVPRLPRRGRCATRAGRAAAEAQGAVHRPLAARAGARPATPTPTQLRGDAPRRSPPSRPARWPRLDASAWQSAGRTPEPWLGPGHPRGHPRARRPPGADGVAGVRARASSPTTSRCSTTSTSRPPAVAAELGLAFARTASLNDDPDGDGGAGRASPRTRRRADGP